MALPHWAAASSSINEGFIAALSISLFPRIQKEKFLSKLKTEFTYIQMFKTFVLKAPRLPYRAASPQA